MPPKPAPTKPGARVPAKNTPAKSPAAKSPAAKTPAAKTPAAKTPAKSSTKPAPAKPGAKTGPAKKEPEKPKAKVWTEKDFAARKIQTKARQYLAKKIMVKLRKDKNDYEELMLKLERDAYVKQVEKFREEAEREREKEEEERRRRKKERERVKKMLEACFDGDEAEIMNLIREIETEDKALGNDAISKGVKQKHLDSLINCEDANQNSPLSEAASGGHAGTVRLLIERGADINTQGHFLRTPLYRAAFAGHLEACEVLLQHGADPQIYASDGCKPADIASQEPIKQLIENWDHSLTEQMLKKIEEQKQKKLAVEKQQREAEMEKLEKQIEDAEKEYSSQELRLSALYKELNKRIYEHDTAAEQGFDKPEVTLQVVHDAEADLEVAKIDFEKARDKLAQSRLKRREQERAGQGLSNDDLPGVKVAIRELEEVLLRDVGNKIAESGRWPLIIDTSGQACTFLRYQDTNYINALKPSDMEPDKVRLSLLGSLRYGKPCVIDFMEIDLFESTKRRFDEILPNLMELILSRELMKEENFKKMIKESDGPQYELKNFRIDRTERFRVFFISKNPFPNDELVDRTYLLRVHIPT